MTTACLLALGEVEGPLGWVLLGPALVALLPVALCMDGAGWLVNHLLHGRVRAATHATCPQGHVVELHGLWSCTCGMTYTGSAFAPCPSCGSRAHACRCPCGEIVVSPVSPVHHG